MVAMPSSYPIRDPGMDLFYTPAFHEDTMTLCSAYNKSSQTHVGDLYSMFAMVPYELWIGYSISFLTFISITSIGNKLLRNPNSSFWLTTCAFLDQDNYPTSRSKFLAFLSPLVMIAMFFMMTYICSFMSTDLVTIDNPVTVTSYDDIVERNISIALSDNTAEYNLFKDAFKGSKEWKMFVNHVKVSASPEETIRFQDATYHQQVVFIARPVIVQTAAYTMMGLLSPTNDKRNTELRTYMGTENDAIKFTNAFVLSSRIVGSRKYKSICRM